MTERSKADHKRADKIRGERETARQKIIREYGLTPDEVSRANTMQAGDEVSLYAGNFAVQARLLVDARDSDTDIALEAAQRGIEEPAVPRNLHFLNAERVIVFEGMGTE